MASAAGGSHMTGAAPSRQQGGAGGKSAWRVDHDAPLVGAAPSNSSAPSVVVVSSGRSSASASGHGATTDDDASVSFSETATFAAGCFWGVEAAFSSRCGPHGGVTRVGYTGGCDERPLLSKNSRGPPKPLTLKDVRTGQFGHAEAVRVRFDPAAVSYAALLQQFWVRPLLIFPGGGIIQPRTT